MSQSNSIEVKKIKVEQILLKRGNTEQQSDYVGAIGEITLDTDLQTVRVHDGVNPGGILLPNELNVQDMVATEIQENIDTFVSNSISNVIPEFLPNLESISSNVVPSEDSVFNLGSPENKWKSLYVSENTIYIGNNAIGVDQGKLIVTEIVDPGEPEPIVANIATEEFVLDQVSSIDIANTVSRIESLEEFNLEELPNTYSTISFVESYVNDTVTNTIANLEPTTSLPFVVLTNTASEANYGIKFPDETVQTTAYSPVERWEDGSYIEQKSGYIKVELPNVIHHDYSATTIEAVQNSHSVDIEYDENILEYANNQSTVSVSTDGGNFWTSAFINSYVEGVSITLTRTDWREKWDFSEAQNITIRTYEGGDPLPWFEIDPDVKGGVVDYCANFGSENIVGTIQLASSNGRITGIHLESMSDPSLSRYDLWHIPDNHNNSISAFDKEGEAATITFQWTAKLFY